MSEASRNPDSPEAAHLRANQEDPMVMHLVVLKTTSSSHSKLLCDAAKAALAVQIELEDTYKEEFNKWWSESFRKIALKAKPAQWNRLLERDDYVRIGDVLAFVPVARSKRHSLFNKLQVLTDLDFEKVDYTQDINRPRSSVRFYVLSSLSLGKQTAQIAHASMMLGDKLGFLKVLDSNFHIVFTKSLPDAPEGKSDQSVVVRDAGLTEIESGTETVLAIFENH